ncbi:hypothetical protein HanRHA438_Chr06g0258441 [Helianthus annuus]|nr:hypothetical protein HanRHA438_Chr06g0258441 [Helianthus annuus]
MVLVDKLNSLTSCRVTPHWRYGVVVNCTDIFDTASDIHFSRYLMLRFRNRNHTDLSPSFKDVFGILLRVEEVLFKGGVVNFFRSQ